ncbi:MAG: dihydroxyacetone kinase subunit DhaL [Planctomycetota bacterium]|jgi:dihydroxyacetone kinase-like protein
MSSFSNKDGVAITLALIDAIEENRQKLSDIDGLIGDGDHGINMHKGFQLCKAQLDPEVMGLSESLKVLGTVLVDKIGGAMGPLYGSFFRAMARASRKSEDIDAEVFVAMLAAAEQKIRDLGECELGDKTLLDVLAPAREAFVKATADGGDFSSALTEMALAAAEAQAATVDMVAKKGRASRLAERSRGVPDAGATSCCVILTTIADTAKKLLA